MQTILAIETSVPHASIALLHKGEIVEHTFESHRQQNQMLFDPLEQIMESLGEDKIDTILIGTGPGSYGGSRIAGATAHGLAIVHGSTLAGICSFYGVKEVQTTPHLAVGDARRGSYFYYQTDIKDTAPDPTLVDKDTFIEMANSIDLPRFTFETQNPIPLENVQLLTPTATELINYWNSLDLEQQEELSSKTLEPLYLRAPFITKSTKSHPLLGNKK